MVTIVKIIEFRVNVTIVTNFNIVRFATDGKDLTNVTYFIIVTIVTFVTNVNIEIFVIDVTIFSCNSDICDQSSNWDQS